MAFRAVLTIVEDTDGLVFQTSRAAGNYNILLHHLKEEIIEELIKLHDPQPASPKTLPA